MNDGEHFIHVVDRLLEVFVSRLRLEGGGKLNAVLLELLDLLSHAINLLLNLKPGHFFPLGDLSVDFGVEAVELIEALDLVIDLLQLDVLGVRQSKESLTCKIRVELALAHVVLFREHFESVHRLLGIFGNLFVVWSIVLELNSEFFDVLNEKSDVFNQLLLELSLLSVQFVARLFRGNHKLFPVVVQLLDLVVLILVQLTLLVLLLEQRVHFVDGL